MSDLLRIWTCVLGIFVICNQQSVHSEETSASIAEAKCAEFFRCFGILCVPGDLDGRPAAIAVNWVGSNFGVHLPDGIDIFPNVTSLTFENDEFNSFVYPKLPFSVFGVPQQATMVAGLDFSKSWLDTTVLPDALFHAKYLQNFRLDLMSGSGALSISKTDSDRPEAVHLPITWKKEVPQIPVRFDIMLNTCFDFPENQLHIWRDGNDEGPVSIRPLSRNLSLEYTAPDRLVAKCIYDDIDRYGDLLREGDRILSIRDVTPERLSFWGIQDELRRTDGTLPMRIERDGEARNIELPIQPDFAYPPEWPEPKPEFNPADE